MLVGHSLGGIVALWLASRNDPDVVGVGAFESPAPWLDDSFDTVGGGALDIAERQGDSEAGEYFYRMMIGEETFSRLRERDVAARRSEGHALVGELRSLRDPAQAFDLSTVKVPVVVGSGTASSQRMQERSTDGLGDSGRRRGENHRLGPRSTPHATRGIRQLCSRVCFAGSDTCSRLTE